MVSFRLISHTAFISLLPSLRVSFFSLGQHHVKYDITTGLFFVVVFLAALSGSYVVQI